LTIFDLKIDACLSAFAAFFIVDFSN
jgi:hypothetical protein